MLNFQEWLWTHTQRMTTRGTTIIQEEETANKGLRENLSKNLAATLAGKENKIISSNPKSFSKQGSKM